MTGMSDGDDSLLGRMAAAAAGFAAGSLLGAVVVAIAVVVGFGIVLVVLSPVLYPAFRGMLCYPLSVYPDIVLSFADWYVSLFEGVYGDLGGCY